VATRRRPRREGVGHGRGSCDQRGAAGDPSLARRQGRPSAPLHARAHAPPLLPRVMVDGPQVKKFGRPNFLTCGPLGANRPRRARLAAAQEALGCTDAGAAREPRLTAGGESYGGRELHL